MHPIAFLEAWQLSIHLTSSLRGMVLWRTRLHLLNRISQLSELSQTEKEKYCVSTSFICGIEKEMIQTEFLTKQRLIDLENEFMVAGGKG